MKVNEIRKEIKGLNLTELQAKEKELKEELFNLRFQKAIGQLDNTARIKEVRKTIARIKTAMREQQSK